MPYLRDVYLAFLIKGARFTKEGYPIIEKWMVATEIPDDIYQWDRRSQSLNEKDCAMSFYCNDQYFQNVISNPDKYFDVFSKYKMIIGMDASPFDNMQKIPQISQVFVNLAFTYYLGRKGIKIVPNVRLGTNVTYSSLKAYPKGTLISIGTNGFVKDKRNRKIFKEQVTLIVKILNPSGILIYGLKKDIFEYAELNKIPLYQFDSYIIKRRRKR